MHLSAGTPHPLGASFDGQETIFALFSAHAEKVELCLFDSEGARELARIALPERTGETWHGRSGDIAPGHHRVTASNTLFRTRVEFDAAAGETVRYRCENGLTGGGMVMVLMMGVAYLKVKLVRLSD